MNAPVPDGFRQVQRGGAFVASLGALYLKDAGPGTTVGIRVEPRHLNSRGVAHGGFLATLADTAMGIAVATTTVPPAPAITVNLTADFTEAAREGDWLEARVELQKLGRRLVFASCQLWAGERRILRASGIFARGKPE
jgi:uncharacterized protein (TIGR00369 family)